MLDQNERKTLEKLLQRERRRLQQVIERHESLGKDLLDHAGELSSYRLHPADLATEAEEREKDFLFASMESARFDEIGEALQRLYKHPDTFGTCQGCGKGIPFERLEVIPETRYCLPCEVKEEAGEGRAVPREAAAMDRSEEEEEKVGRGE